MQWYCSFKPRAGAVQATFVDGVYGKALYSELRLNTEYMNSK